MPSASQPPVLSPLASAHPQGLSVITRSIKQMHMLSACCCTLDPAKACSVCHLVQLLSTLCHHYASHHNLTITPTTTHPTTHPYHHHPWQSLQPITSECSPIPGCQRHSHHHSCPHPSTQLQCMLLLALPLCCPLGISHASQVVVSKQLLPLLHTCHPFIAALQASQQHCCLTILAVPRK